MSENLSDTGWQTMTVAIPPEVVAIGIMPDLQRVFDAMVYKFRRNAHKGHWGDIPLDQALAGLRAEVEELDAAIAAGSSSEILMESADVANMAVIAANAALALKGL